MRFRKPQTCGVENAVSSMVFGLEVSLEEAFESSTMSGLIMEHIKKY